MDAVGAGFYGGVNIVVDEKKRVIIRVFGFKALLYCDNILCGRSQPGIAAILFAELKRIAAAGKA